MNEEITNILTYINSIPLKMEKVSADLEELHLMPDGAVLFYEANKDRLIYKVQINDLRFPNLHRNNGITKINIMTKNNK